MQRLINIGLMLSGAGPKLWNMVDGVKTYTAVALKVLTALAGLLGELQPQLEAHNLGAIAGLAKGLANDPYWHMLTDSLLALGFGHKLEKAVGGLTVTGSLPPELPQAGVLTLEPPAPDQEKK